MGITNAEAKIMAATNGRPILETAGRIVDRLEAENAALREQLAAAQLTARSTFETVIERDRLLAAAQKDAAKWKQMAEWQYALRVYPQELDLGIGALDAYFKGWTYDAAIEKENEECLTNSNN